jgi:oligogalacturonide lyase
MKRQFTTFLFFFLITASVAAKPTLWLVGDSTVNTPTKGQDGWGEVLEAYLDLREVSLENRAMGGRSSRTFRSEGRWQAVLEAIRPGDVVLIQFGHNDSSPINDDRRARGVIDGIGEETVEIDNMLSGERETVYTFGHYLKAFVTEAREVGARPILCSLVPRKIWLDNGELQRDSERYAGWTKMVARELGADFIDLNEIIARRYESLGRDAVEAFFADEHTHTTTEGAMVNAAAVVAGLRGLPKDPFASWFNQLGERVQPFPPRVWIDSSTGYRVKRLSEEPGTASLYFHQNAYPPEGDVIVVTTPSGIATIDLETGEQRLVVEGDANVMVIGRMSRSVYYTRHTDSENAVYATHLDTLETRLIATLPENSSVVSINADETLLLGSRTLEAARPLVSGTSDAARDGGGRPQGEWMRETTMHHPVTGEPLTFAEQKEWRLNDRLEARIPMEIFVLETETGAIRPVHAATDWLNHLQFSPTDPEQILFCHEGPWHKVDRIWTIRTDGTELQSIHERTMNMEIAGHEFFSPDGQTIWYDLQRPRGEVFWLAGYNLSDGRRTWYALDRNEWSVHFNVSPDGQLFAGDGGDREMVAHAPDGQWIYLFRPRAIPDVAGISAENAEDLIHPGRLESVRLVDMRQHNYRLEPNVTFTPDGKRIVFRSNMHGATHVYAVDLVASDEALAE